MLSYLQYLLSYAYSLILSKSQYEYSSILCMAILLQRCCRVKAERTSAQTVPAFLPPSVLSWPLPTRFLLSEMDQTLRSRRQHALPVGVNIVMDLHIVFVPTKTRLCVCVVRKTDKMNTALRYFPLASHEGILKKLGIIYNLCDKKLCSSESRGRRTTTQQEFYGLYIIVPPKMKNLVVSRLQPACQGEQTGLPMVRQEKNSSPISAARINPWPGSGRSWPSIGADRSTSPGRSTPFGNLLV